MSNTKGPKEHAAEAVARHWARSAQGLSSEARITLGRAIQENLLGVHYVPKLWCANDQMAAPLEDALKSAGLDGCPWPVQATTTRFWDGGAEVLARGLPGSPYTVLYPVVVERASGDSMEDLVRALNGAVGKWRPWVLLRRASFTHDEFGNPMKADRAGDWELFQSDPDTFWKKRGVTDAALANMRPDDLLVADMTEADAAGRWLLLGAELG